MKTIKALSCNAFGLFLLLFSFGCAVKVEPLNVKNNKDSRSHTEQILKGLGTHDTKVHGVTLPDIK
ncbi:MAG: hypothetical protein HGB36_11490 [Chlorobiaceae bacterium]|nr:hypothetical protein [Chlorobiaceae bacterium]